jgi:hypothetical protein
VHVHWCTLQLSYKQSWNKCHEGAGNVEKKWLLFSEDQEIDNTMIKLNQMSNTQSFFKIMHHQRLFQKDKIPLACTLRSWYVIWEISRATSNGEGHTLSSYPDLRHVIFIVYTVPITYSNSHRQSQSITYYEQYHSTFAGHWCHFGLPLWPGILECY